MDEIPLLLVARLLDMVEVEAVVDAALAGRVALVPLEDAPLSKGRHAMVVHAPGLPEPFVLSAVPEGDETGGLFPLRLRPTDDKQIAKLRAISAARKSTRPPKRATTKSMPRQGKAKGSGRTSKPPSRPPQKAPSKPPARPASKPPRQSREDRTLPDAKADPLLGFALARGKYVIEAPLGGGAYGKVYRARHTTLNKAVAVKVLQGFMERDEEFAARFQREALAASKLDHPNVAQVMDYGEEPDGMLYIVMELLEGATLRDIMHEAGRLPVPRIVELVTQLCAALTAAHEAGIVHRDIKPENMLLVPKKNDEGMMVEVLKVCDFGIASVQSRASDSGASYLSTGGTSVAGTPEYMSPEQARGEKVDERSDIYATGVVLYEMATGQVPFTGNSAVAILVAHASDAPRPPSQINRRLDKRLEIVILRALEKEPSKRQQTARELRADLRRIVSGSGEVRAKKGPLAPPIPREEREEIETEAILDDNTPTAPLARAQVYPAIRPASAPPAPAPPPPPPPTEAPEPTEETTAPIPLTGNATPEATSSPPPHDLGPPPPPLTDPMMGFAEFLGAVTSAVARTTYYERAHPEFARSLAQLASVMGKPLERRAEISFARRDAQTHELVVMTGVGEMMELVKAAPGGVGAGCAQRLGEVFSRRGLVSLTFKEGLGEDELGDAVELLSGPEIAPKELQAQFAARGLTKVSILFAQEMIGRDRRLPWQVMLCVSRIARDLEAVPQMVRAAETDRRRRLRTALISDVTRALKTPEHVKVLLTSWDLIAEQVGDKAGIPSAEIPSVLVGSLAHPMLLRVASLILAEMEKDATAGPPAGGSSAPPAGTSVRQLMQVIGSRFIRERTIESDEVLRELHSRAVLSFPELPEDVQMWVLAEQQAEQLAVDPEPILRVLDSVFELPRYAREVATLARAMRVLARRGAVGPLWTIVVRLQQRHARGAAPSEESREGLAARTLESLDDADVLRPVANVLLAGDSATTDAAHGVLVAYGRAGAQAICTARAEGMQCVRMRYVEALKEIGKPATMPLATQLERVVGTLGGDEDTALAEDVLRSLPDVQDERLGMLVSKLLRHKSAAVRRAAVAALAAPWGPQARSVLFGAVDDQDEGVRVAALTGLRKVGHVDLDIVRRAARIFDGTAPAGANACAVTAALLADVVPDARPEAVKILCAAIAPRARGVVALFTSVPDDWHHVPIVAETIARTLLAIGGPQGRDAVKKRASKSSGELQKRLKALLEPRR